MKKRYNLIPLLLFVNLLLAAGCYFYYQSMLKKIVAVREKSEEIDPSTIAVERGDIANIMDDLTGTIRSNQSVYLYWKISGTVSDVYVEVGDQVREGDLLAELDQGTIDSSIIEAVVDKEAAEESLERLFTSTLFLEEARTAVISAKKESAEAQKNYDVLTMNRAGTVEIGSKYDDYLKASDAYNIAKTNYENLKDLPLDNADRIMAQEAMDEAKYNMDYALTQYNWYNGDVTEIDIQTADANLKTANAKLDDALRAYNRIKDGPSENQIRILQARIESDNAIINDSKIISPINGTVAQVEVKQYDRIIYEKNAMVRNILAVRIDDLSSHYVDIKIPELKINKISVGQDVSVSFDAIPLKKYTGTIVNISNAGNVTKQAVNFDVTVKMDDVDDKIKSGMMADVEIVLEEARNVLLVPSIAVSISPDTGEHIIKKILPDGSTSEIPVTIGVSSKYETQIISDQIVEGDMVYLNKDYSIFDINGDLLDMIGENLL